MGPMGAFFYVIFGGMGMVLKKTDLLLFELLRFALDTTGELQCFAEAPTDAQWKAIYELAKRQCVRGVAFLGIKKLPENVRPARALLLRWSLDAEAIAGKNKLMDQEGARLTQIFEGAGRKNAILKGQANARLYPDVLSRQAGDIDIWVEGGRKNVSELLYKLNLLNAETDDHAYSLHHIHLPETKDGIAVEVHFKPASGIPFRNGALQEFLNEEIRKAEKVPEGFYSPSIKFALLMQMAHLQQHFYSGGLGLRQYMDYLMLLRHSTESDRSAAVAIMKRLSMMRACGAVMWLLQQVFGLEQNLMLCAPDRRRGERLLKLALAFGNFGQYKSKPKNVFVRWYKDRLQTLSWLPFDPVNAIFKELKYWRATISLIPLRIKRRRVAL
ncbi:Uncharacterised nucleotidyltransferase [Fibrobacter sp. UWB10]|nr:Uncharacterised nucleotidyltransferase [Fibrobacter sp. UWB10]